MGGARFGNMQPNHHDGHNKTLSACFSWRIDCNQRKQINSRDDQLPSL